MKQTEITVLRNSSLYNYISSHYLENKGKPLELYGSLFYIVGIDIETNTKTHFDLYNKNRPYVEILGPSQTTFRLNYKSEADAKTLQKR